MSNASDKIILKVQGTFRTELQLAELCRIQKSLKILERKE